MKKWLGLCENEALFELTDNQLMEKRVCSKHFLDSDFNALQGVSKRTLKACAIPQKRNAIDNSSLDILESPISVNNQIEDHRDDCLSACFHLPTSSTVPVLIKEKNDTPPLAPENVNDSLSHTLKDNVLNKSKKKNFKILQNKDLHSKVKCLIREVKTLKQKIVRLRKRKPAVSKESVLNQVSEYVNDEVFKFIKMQFNHEKQKKWEEDEKQFALGLYYKSPKAYLFLKDVKQFALPSISTIRQWVNVINLKPGKNIELCKQLKLKLESKTIFEKESVLMWDEMANRPGLEYNLKEDYVEGYHDLSDDFGGRKAEMAKSVLVIMLSGLTHDWKQPLMYFPTNGSVSGTTLKDIILNVLEITDDIGFRVRHMVCDQGSTNQKAIASLGINKDRPFIELNNRKITFAFDGPHILKCLRNNLIKRNYIIDNVEVSWAPLIELRELERTKVCKAAPKLTDRHLNPNNFEKMNVRLAAQIFSNSVYAALMAGATCGALKHSATIATSNFLKRINDIFDCLNARSLNDSNPLKRGLSDKNQQVELCLKNAVPWIAKWEIDDKKNRIAFLIL